MSRLGDMGDMYARADESADELVAGYRAATAAADRAIDELDLDAPGRHHLGITVSLRWMLFTVLLDTARHAGHADIVRELIDGAAGSHREWPGVAPADDEEYRSTYLARVRGEVDDAAGTSSFAGVGRVRQRADSGKNFSCVSAGRSGVSVSPGCDDRGVFDALPEDVLPEMC